MSKADKLLKKAESFEKLAIYSDRRTFLRSLAQDQPGLPPGPYEPISSYGPQKTVQPGEIGMGFGMQGKGLDGFPVGTPNTQVQKPVGQAFVKEKAPGGYNKDHEELEVTDAYEIMQKAQPLLVAGQPWAPKNLEAYQNVVLDLEGIVKRLQGQAKAAEEVGISEEDKKPTGRIGRMNAAIAKSNDYINKLRKIYSPLLKAKSKQTGMSEEF